ncbi:MAG: hypothetical protein Q7R92_00055 [bacterium]|nr:hypothetical protein [bacterium]
MNLDKETVEAIIAGLLFAVSLIIYFLIKNEIKNRQKILEKLEDQRLALAERLDEAFRHIGQVNIQIQEVKSIFSEFKKYPKSKGDFKSILKNFAQKVLSMVDVDWVLFRIVDLENLKTLKEYSQARGGSVLLKSAIENSALVYRADFKEYTILNSGQENLSIKAFCVLPKKEIKQEARILISAIASQLEMMFLIFTPAYLMNEHDIKQS